MDYFYFILLLLGFSVIILYSIKYAINKTSIKRLNKLKDDNVQFFYKKNPNITCKIQKTNNKNNLIDLVVVLEQNNICLLTTTITMFEDNWEIL